MWNGASVYNPPGNFRSNSERQKGFTLIELMISVALLIILVTVAVPAFQGVVESRRITTKTNLLLSSVNTTRSEAIKRGEVVTLKAVDDDFAKGWCIYLGESGGGCDSETPIRTYEGSEALNINADGDTQLEFSPQGSLHSPGNQVALTVSPPEGQTQANYLCISLSGRASINGSGC
ncbi:GspH/FimT family pseudopilin [Vreelandella utahensis]|uniref:GspH/FimT family pseudopilin n=1 Tax=Vreelandella halophila TaxID=86177 RepID=UPI0009854B42|nr:GspH/FimT family pseudopilin [Halomonas utahensis]